MARLLIGVDSSNIGCIKITKNNADSPYSTEDTAYGKFSFNSKWETNVRFVGVDQLNYGGGSFAEFLPAGTDKSSFQRARTAYSTGVVSLYWKSSFWAGVEYDLPVFDMKTVNDAGVYTYGRISTGAYGYQGRTTVFKHLWNEEGGYVNSFFPGAGNYINVAIPLSLISFATSGVHKKAVVWNLPGDETAIKDPPLAPVPGQMQVQITKDFCRVSKPGYDVRVATASQLAFDSSRRPVKVVASGDIGLPTGTTSFDFSSFLAGINVSGELIADVIQYKGSTIYFPCTPPTDDDIYGAYYQIVGTSIVFTNPGSACRARFLIISQDNTAASVGSNKVFRQLSIGGQDVFQFLRPGAANPPNLADVIIDSRWPVLQIVKTGVFGIPDGANQQTVVNFDSTGLFPFIKYFTIHGAGEPNDSQTGSSDATGLGKRIRLPYASAGYYDRPSQPRVRFTPGDSTYCTLTTNEARFFTNKTLPLRYELEQTQVNPGYTVKTIGVSCPAYAIRYYILGIPA
ncbi:hypothetical protein J2W42_002193 [Rhizobium tibeticum]|uniref:hypothetical protein n=1 Tax=Rhizobium tibeticum TaxID=501024 RepID=UPI00278AE756|nr:hypothetical protein [Rhizobium tibeticum]MDP9809345.1 hypothetical protein [Rhizobium tibeticum]